MYNFTNEEIPVFFPVLEGVQLQPWFTTAGLDKGLELIRQNKITNFHCSSNATGALLEHQATVILQFAKSTRLHQDFIIQNSHCGRCGRQKNNKVCAHLAALAILSLSVPKEQTKAIPIPLVFAESDWLKLGLFLYEWLSMTKYTVRQSIKKNFPSGK